MNLRDPTSKGREGKGRTGGEGGKGRDVYFSLSLPRNISYILRLHQTYQVSRISGETPAFWSHLPLTRRVTKISRISVLSTNKILINQCVISK